jgi:phenylacetate-coenzyme A ligase PaaK-like adenylate-forming protein
MADEGFDRFRSRVQERLFARLPVHVSRLAWSREQIAIHQRDTLRALLADAKARSPYHARRLAGVDPEGFELCDLPRLPIMSKAELMANFDDVLTGPPSLAASSRGGHCSHRRRAHSTVRRVSLPGVWR